jgi:hypothetical protein
VSEARTQPLLTAVEIEAFAADWYRKLDAHVAAAELLPMLSDRSLAFHLPEGVLRSRDEFRDWYAGGPRYPGVVNLFFDEVHTLTAVDVAAPGNPVQVRVAVNWQARRWRAPRPRSEWIGFDADQQWELQRSPEDGAPVITRYVVNALRPMAGSPAL